MTQLTKKLSFAYFKTFVYLLILFFDLKYNNGNGSRNFADESLEMIQNHPEPEDNDVEYIESEFESPPVPVFATNQAARLYEPSSSFRKYL